MKNQITKKDILENSMFFWLSYLSWFRGFDDEKELNIDEVLQNIFEVDFREMHRWANGFFGSTNKNPKCITRPLTENLSFQIQFFEDEIVYFINNEYIGNLGGHFEAWSLTVNEIKYFQKFDFAFLLLLPMVGISEKDIESTKALISKNLKLIPEFIIQSDYIAKLIVNGLIMREGFYKNPEVGIINNQNHSVRNIEQYPDYKASVIRLNKILKITTNKT